ARGELTLIKLRDKIEGRRTSRPATPTEDLVVEIEVTDEEDVGVEVAAPAEEPEAWADVPARMDLGEDSLVNPKHSLADAPAELVGVLRSPDAVRSIPDVDRANLAKYLTIAKLRLENAIAIVRTGDAGWSSPRPPRAVSPGIEKPAPRAPASSSPVGSDGSTLWGVPG